MNGKDFLRSHDGTALVETAGTLALLLTLIFGIFDCARALYTNIYLGYAARQGAHYAMTRGASWSGNPCSTTATVSCTATSANITAYIQGIMAGGVGTSSGVSVVTTWPGTTAAGNGCTINSSPTSAGCLVQVQVSFDYAFLLPFVPRNLAHMQSVSSLTISQ